MEALRYYKHQEGRWYSSPLPEKLPERHVLIRIKAFGVNRADLLQAKGLYPPPKGAPDILGLEGCGVIEAVGKEVKEFKEGDKVMFLSPSGAYASHIVLPESLCLPLPSSLTFEEGAALPEALFTCYYNLKMLANLNAGEKVLVYSAAGGIGTTALQLIDHWKAKAIAVTGTEEKQQWLKKHFSVENVFCYRDKDFESKLLNTFKNEIAIIWDTVANARYCTLHEQLLIFQGRWVIIGLLGAKQPFTLKPALWLKKNLRLIASTLRNQPLSLKTRIRNELQKLLPYYEQRKLKPVIYKVLPYTAVSQAFELLRQNQVMGKVVLSFSL